jgi:hypothetical protein
MTLPLPRLTPPVPLGSSFSRGFRPFPLRANTGLKMTRAPTASAVFVVGRLDAWQKKDLFHVARAQQEEVYRLLSESNLGPLDLLTRLSGCATPFAQLLTQAADELSFTTNRTRSHHVEDLERNAAVDSAKKEVEIQQLAQRLERARAEGAATGAVLAKHTRTLEKLNHDFQRISDLMHANGIDADKDPPPRDVELDDGIDIPHAIPLDEAQYRVLWAANLKLQEDVENLRLQLAEVQGRQEIAMRERARELLQARTRVLT